MKVLFLHSNQTVDYLADSLFHGLRELLGSNCVDVPRHDTMYQPLTDSMKSKLRGNGFTLYGLLEDIPELSTKRFLWSKDLDEYDFIVVAHPELQWHLLFELASRVNSEKLVIIDGNDTTAFFPFYSLGWQLKNCPWTYLTPIKKFKYFKRELVGEGSSYALDRLLPRFIRKWVSFPQNSFPFGFSIPQEKLYKGDKKEKIKDFPTHIVDAEVAAHVSQSFFSATSSDKHIFISEDSYYEDLRRSSFGITVKRGGWDCLRHYELAANGCVLCFRDLDQKPKTCAPHGLNKSNCIIYHNYDDLKKQITSITDDKYHQLQQETYKWIENHTTIARAKKFLTACSSNLINS